MSLGWMHGLHSFDKPERFADQSAEAEKRREALFATARRGDVMSYYEARSLPFGELIAMAVEQEDVARRDYKKDGDTVTGKTADGRMADFNAYVYSLREDSEFEVLTWSVLNVSEYVYLMNLRCPKIDREVVFPSRLVFTSKAIAEFMRGELIAYSVTPDVRQVR